MIEICLNGIEDKVTVFVNASLATIKMCCEKNVIRNELHKSPP